MTHVTNLPAIVRDGVLPLNVLKRQGGCFQSIAEPGVQELRARVELLHNGEARNLHDQAPLYFAVRTPMLFSRRELQDSIAYVEVDPAVLELPDVVLADGNAAMQACAGGLALWPCTWRGLTLTAVTGLTDPQIVGQAEDRGLTCSHGPAGWTGYPGKRSRQTIGEAMTKHGARSTLRPLSRAVSLRASSAECMLATRKWPPVLRRLSPRWDELCRFLLAPPCTSRVAGATHTWRPPET
jgi:ssDNA thymidine ADP-ribosyltransferase, DarT